MARATPRVERAALIDPANPTQTIPVGSPHWYAWLQGATTFAFSDASGRFTARKERRGPADGYWRAYRKQAGVVRSAYLGVTADLTLERLQAVATTLAQLAAPSASAAQPAPRAEPPAHLLRTKFTAPPARSLLVARQRLTERLQAGLAGRLTLIAAPAGFGKTTMVSAWRASPGALPLAWVALDTRDNDPARFWSYVVAALDTIHAGVGAPALALLQSAQPPPTEVILTTLLNALSGWPADVALMLDDYHVIDAPQIHQALAFLLDHMPPQLHLVIASRADPPLPLSRLRARGELAEIRAADLRFTPDEAASFLNGVMGVSVSDEAAAALEARTEGWAAGLQFAALAMRDRADHERFIAAFTGSNRFVMDYLVEEVLGRLPAHLQSFLLRTSILDRLCGPLCDDLTRDALPTPPVASQAVLEELERTNLFLIALDDQRRWYRYHHLFAEVLRARLMASVADSTTVALHRAASGWYEQRQMFAEAVQHAQQAQDAERATRMIEQHGLTTALRGQLSTVQGWLAALPEPLIRASPRLCILDATLLASTNRLQDADARLSDAEGAIAPDLPAEQARSIRGQVALLRANMAYIAGDLAHAIALAQRARDQLPETEVMGRGAALVSIAHAYRVTGDVMPAAERLAREASELTRANGNLLARIAAVTNLAELLVRQGRLRQAAVMYEEAAQSVSDPLWLQVPVNGVLYAFGVASLLYEWNDLDAAERHLQQGMEMARGALTVTAESVAQGYLTLARLRHARGDYGGARATIDALLDLARQRAFAEPLRARGAALRAQLGLSHSLPEAVGWADASGLRADDAELPYLREAEYLALARVHLAVRRGDLALQGPHGIVRLLDQLLARAEQGGRMGSVIEILVVRALALDARGDRADALATLERALRMAEPEGYARVFLDESRPMAALLAQIAGGDSPAAAYAGRLLAAFPDARFSGAHPAPQAARGRIPSAPLAEPLTERELEVLRLIEAGRSNQAISDTLVVAISTVKKHINNLYGKLSVQSRTQALLRARELGLL